MKRVSCALLTASVPSRFGVQHTLMKDPKTGEILVEDLYPLREELHGSFSRVLKVLEDLKGDARYARFSYEASPRSEEDSHFDEGPSGWVTLAVWTPAPQDLVDAAQGARWSQRHLEGLDL